MSDNIEFTPSDRHREVKARFWSKAQDYNYMASDKITLATALEVTGDQKLKRFWAIDGFEDWFGDSRRFEAEILALVYEFPAYAKAILDSDSPQISAKVNLLKLLAEIANKMPAKTKEIIVSDKGINKLDEDQLRKQIAEKTKKLKGISNG